MVSSGAALCERFVLALIIASNFARVASASVDSAIFVISEIKSVFMIESGELD